MGWQNIALWIGLFITFGLGLVNLLWGPAILARREKVKISVPRPNYATNMHDSVLRVFCGVSFRRLGGEKVRNVDQICLKPDAQIYQELNKYFNLPKDGVIRISELLELPQGEIVSSGQRHEPIHPEYSAVEETKGSEKWEKASQLALELGKKAFHVCLIWEDGGKTKWKKIKREVHGWVTL
jgi:hypothetical protein